MAAVNSTRYLGPGRLAEVCERCLLGVFGAGDEGTSDGKSGGVGEFAEDLWLAVLVRAGDAEEGRTSVEDTDVTRNALRISVTC